MYRSSARQEQRPSRRRRYRRAIGGSALMTARNTITPIANPNEHRTGVVAGPLSRERALRIDAATGCRQTKQLRLPWRARLGNAVLGDGQILTPVETKTGLGHARDDLIGGPFAVARMGMHLSGIGGDDQAPL